jgi:hypothetical protein
VKLPGNAGLFFNLVMPPFSFYFVPNAGDWIVNTLGLELSPSPMIVFLQNIRYTTTYMLHGVFFIYSCFFICLALMILVPVLKCC